jgi:integrase
VTEREALARYVAHAGRQRGAYVERYLQGCAPGADPASGATLAAHLERLLRDGLGRGTINLHYTTVRAFFAFCRRPEDQGGLGISCNVPRVGSWKYDPRESRRAFADRERLISPLARACQEGRWAEQEAAVVVLACVYGMRAGELAAVTAADVDLPRERFYIRTEKDGMPRWCWLPPGLHRWMPEQWAPVTARDLHKLFGRIWDEVVGEQRPPYAGWHAIRRALDKELVEAGVDLGAVGRFLRWKGGGQARLSGAERMALWYAQANLAVGVGGARTSVRTDDDQGARAYDAAVWDRHPFLAYFISGGDPAGLP